MRDYATFESYVIFELDFRHVVVVRVCLMAVFIWGNSPVFETVEAHMVGWEFNAGDFYCQ